MTFEQRHIGNQEKEIRKMISALGYQSMDQLIEDTIPDSIKQEEPLSLEPAMSEHHYLAHIRSIMNKNTVCKTYIGQGYYNTITPSVILRNIFENPGWYTQYTPYQAEISQGRLEALLNFQTVISELCELDIANASLLDESTAAAEAMHMLYQIRPHSKKDATTLLVDTNCFQQTRDLLKTRAHFLPITVTFCEPGNMVFSDDVFGILLQNPNAKGTIHDYSSLNKTAHDADCHVAMICDLLSLTLFKSPGEMGADIAVGTSQRFGIPLGYGGPHAAFFATKTDYARKIPGRLIGATIDSREEPALRMALQTREQHIRRDKATSNICTAQALLAIMAGMYAVYHGPNGLKDIAKKIHSLTTQLKDNLNQWGTSTSSEFFFDTLCFEEDPSVIQSLKKSAEKQGINLFFPSETQVQLSLDETTELDDIHELTQLFLQAKKNTTDTPSRHSKNKVSITHATLPKHLARTRPYLKQATFNQYHSESQLMRYIKHLENKDLSLCHSMIPLGSCTMKLNSASSMIPLSFPNVASLHPFVPRHQASGYLEVINDLEKALCAITEFDAFSFQPNSGAQGEYAGLLSIKHYFKSKNEEQRNVALIPTSAHGTNPASAALVGMDIVPLNCLSNGDIDLDDLDKKLTAYRDTIAVLMVTYPSTHGVFEEHIQDICQKVHASGGQVYMDGANMNAQVGLTSPGRIGADVCHLNLHKTFSIPHGGGGPGMGPIGVKAHLAPHLPQHWCLENGESDLLTVAAAPYSSASILLISYAYIKLLGSAGLTQASKLAILNANYIKARLDKHYPILFTGKKGCVAHELIIDCKPFKKQAQVTVEDIAKRLMDYGFHAPTMSWPSPNTLMIEPTESESLDELDFFCDALIEIKKEIDEITSGKQDSKNNLLKNAPHTLNDITQDTWDRSYSIKQAVFPLKKVKERKFWPTVNRINQAHGDKNLICTCQSWLESVQEV